MSFAENPYASWGTVAVNAQADERADFIRKTYLNLLGAVLAYAGVLAALLQTSIPAQMLQLIGRSQYSWLIVLGAFMGISWLANSWATSSTSKAMQYAGLGLYVVGQAFITLPLVYLAHSYDVGHQTNILASATVITIVSFIGLTVAAFATGIDFSFLKTALILVGFAMLGLIVCSILFGFQLNMAFTVAGIVLAGGYILYYTSQVMQHFQIGQHVAAALALFAAVALLFYYVLMFVMQSRR